MIVLGSTQLSEVKQQSLDVFLSLVGNSSSTTSSYESISSVTSGVGILLRSGVVIALVYDLLPDSHANILEVNPLLSSMTVSLFLDAKKQLIMT